MNPNRGKSDNKKQKKPDGPKRKNLKIRLLYILLGICITAAVVSAIGLGYELYISSQGQAYYADLTAGIKTRRNSPDNNNNGSTANPPEVTDTSDNTNEETGVDTDVNADAEPREPVWMPYVDFDALRESLPGILAWIKLEGSVINYPIMQWTDNYYFLSRLADGTRHRSGSIFLDYRNNADFSDKNILIYGHESRTGDMFGVLKSYRKQLFYEENPVIHIYTQEKDYELLLVAGYLIDSGVESPPLVFDDDAAFEKYIAALKKRSFFRSDVAVGAEDRIVSLCTCAYDYPNARLVIVGKLQVCSEAQMANEELRMRNEE